MEGAAEPDLPTTSRILPSRFGACLFACKATLLRFWRRAYDMKSGPRRQPNGLDLVDAAIVATSTSALWPEDDEDALLSAGKVQNLRVAIRALDGGEVQAGQVLGFWKQVGRASRRRGYVEGRELREGCLVPSVGGGLCQLSNALYDAALSAGLEIVERHAHSKVVPHSSAAKGRDATVFWNYIDLRLRSSEAWRIEVDMDGGALRVTIRGWFTPTAAPPASCSQMPPTQHVQACGTCDGFGCWRHAPQAQLVRRKTWVRLADEWPEFADDRARRYRPSDRVLTGGGLPPLGVRLWRRWKQRGLPLPERRRFDAVEQARALARRLHFTDRDLVIPQELLVPWWRSGILAGRRFEVLMEALPARELQLQLDLASMRHPDSHTLVDFRIDPAWVADEAAALARADAWITPHHLILEHAGAATIALPWQMPEGVPLVEGRRRQPEASLQLLLPASALARKGVHALRAVLRESAMTLLLPPGAEESPGFWEGCSIRRVSSLEAGLAQADAAVLPAWVEHQPRGLLLALASGIPVIATAACGLPRDGGWVEVPAGDSVALAVALRALPQRADPTLPA